MVVPKVSYYRYISFKGPSLKYVRPKMTNFESPTHPSTQKYAFALPPTPPLYKRILVTHFQNTMNEQIQEYKSY